MSAAVVSTSVIGSAAMTIQRGRGSAAASARICVPERPGVGEEQRRVEAEDRRARAAARRRGSCAGRGSPGGRRTRPSIVWYGHQARRKTLRIDSATAIAMPGSTPSSATPRNAAIESRNSVRRWRQSRIVPRDVGERERRGDHDGREGRLGQVPQQARARARASATIAAAPTTPGELRLRARLLGDRGARAARADREALEEAGGDVRGADPDHLLVAVDLLAACARRTPTPSRSCRPARRARCPTAPANSSGRSDSRRSGSVSGGKPCGSVPTSDTPWSPRSKRPTARDRERPPRRARRGPSAASRCRTRITPRPTAPTASAAGDRVPVGDARRRTRCASSMKPVGVDREPEQLRQLADEDRQRQPVHVADLRRLREQVGDEPEPRDARPTSMIAPTISASIDASATARCRVAVGADERQDRRRDHRARATSPGRARGSATARTPRSRPGTGSTCRGR